MRFSLEELLQTRIELLYTIALPSRLFDCIRSVLSKVWSWHNSILLEVSILGPHPRSTEPESLWMEPSNAEV